MKRNQRYIVGVILALAVLLATAAVAQAINYGEPFELENTWEAWAIALLLITGIEYVLFRGQGR